MSTAFIETMDQSLKLALRTSLAIGALALLVGCKPPAEHKSQSEPPAMTRGPLATAVIVFSPTLQKALAQRDQVLTAKRTPLPLSDGTVVEDCRSYIKARKVGAQVVETVEAQLVSSEYLLCEAVDLLPVPTGIEAKTESQLTARLANDLDLRTFPSSLGPQLSAERHALAALGAALKSEGNTVAIEDESSSIRFEIVAEADVDGDGQLDGIVWLADEARDGNYRSYATLVVRDIGVVGPLRAKTYPAN